MDWKFKKSSKKFHKNIDNLLNLNISKKDLIHHYPLFSGTVLIARHLTIYEIYKKILNLPGDIAEIGIFKGGSFLFLAKEIIHFIAIEIFLSGLIGMGI